MERTTTLCVWFLFMTFLGVSINGEGQQHLVKKTRSSAVVVGTVFCDTCFDGAFKSPNHLIPGALVEVECLDENSKPSFRQEVKTNEHGEFKAKLPFSVSKHVKKIKRCSVKLLSSSQPYCSIAASATSSSLKRLKSSHHGENTRVFSAGFFTFKPENQPDICSQKPINLHESKPLLPDPAFPPAIKDPVPNPSPLPIPNLPIVPPLPDLPLPQIPPLLPPGTQAPLLPPGPQKSVSLHKKKDDSLEDKKTKTLKPDAFLPPNPLTSPLLPPNPLNPPSLIPPNPLLPSPPVLPLPPVPGINPPSTLPTVPGINPPSTLPTIPGITPPSPPPQKPASLYSKKDNSLEDKKAEVLKPNFFFLPPNPLNPPVIPNPLNPPVLPPNPLNPPGLIPPNPLIPSPPTLPLPPLPFQPPPSTLLPPLPAIPSLPPVPGINPPSPPPPSFPFPLPPIFPGIPPASSSFSTHHQP